MAATAEAETILKRILFSSQPVSTTSEALEASASYPYNAPTVLATAATAVCRANSQHEPPVWLWATPIPLCAAPLIWEAHSLIFHLWMGSQGDAGVSWHWLMAGYTLDKSREPTWTLERTCKLHAERHSSVPLHCICHHNSRWTGLNAFLCHHHHAI